MSSAVGFVSLCVPCVLLLAAVGGALGDGVITNGNGSYHPYANMYEEIVCDPGSVISFEVLRLELECAHDFATLTNPDGSIIFQSQTPCELRQTGLSFTSTSNRATFTFQSDYSIEYLGYNITWTCSNTCHNLQYNSLSITDSCQSGGHVQCVSVSLAMGLTPLTIAANSTFVLSTTYPPNTIMSSSTQKWTTRNNWDQSSNQLWLCTNCIHPIDEMHLRRKGCAVIVSGHVTSNSSGGIVQRTCSVDNGQLLNMTCANEGDSSRGACGAGCVVIIVVVVIMSCCCCCAIWCTIAVIHTNRKIKENNQTVEAVSFETPAFRATVDASLPSSYIPLRDEHIPETSIPVRSQISTRLEEKRAREIELKTRSRLESTPFQNLLASLQEESSEFKRVDLAKAKLPAFGTCSELSQEQMMQLVNAFQMTSTKTDVLKCLKQQGVAKSVLVRIVVQCSDSEFKRLTTMESLDLE